MQNVKITILEEMLDFVAPHICCGCGEIGRLLCTSCEYNITSAQHFVCLVCLAPAKSGICSKHGKDLDFGWLVGSRSGVLRNLIDGYKFNNIRQSYKTLADLLYKSMPPLPKDIVIVPVPTVQKHIRERGYDHMDLIVRRLAYMSGLKVDRVIERRSDFVQHHAISRAQRQAQAEDAFFVSGKIEAGVSYLIVDDVVTTGATIKNIARLLRAMGSAQVGAAVIAYQPLD